MNCTWVILSLFVGPGRIVDVSAEVEFCSLIDDETWNQVLVAAKSVGLRSDDIDRLVAA